ncbi:MAG: hypothetical protein V4484_04140 [Pseudomonadota bacterium]
MPNRITQPSKEQVRAYMATRELARRPPPPPEEIRRQLGWRLQRCDEDRLLLQFYLIPTNYTQMATQIVVDWMLALLRSPLGARRQR